MPHAAAPGSQPSYLAPGQPVGNGQPGANGGLPGGGTGGTGGTASLFIIGKVTAVTSTSITIGGGHSITAAVSGDIRVTGKVSGIRGVKVGDQVSAQMTQSGGKTTATAIQDPAQTPPGGGLP